MEDVIIADHLAFLLDLKLTATPSAYTTQMIVPFFHFLSQKNKKEVIMEYYVHETIMHYQAQYYM